MFQRSLLFVSTVCFSAVHAAGVMKPYIAEIKPFPGTSDSVSGKVVVFSMGDETSVAYGGFVSNLENGLEASTCTAANGCGVHLHEGKSCETTDAALGHYFVDTVVAEDPWTEVRYSSDENGDAKFSGIVEVGTDDFVGRAFVGTCPENASSFLTCDFML